MSRHLLKTKCLWFTTIHSPRIQNYGIIELWQNDWVISLRWSSMICSVLSSQSSFPSTTFRAGSTCLFSQSCRNILMINLAVSDLLAALTMPLTAMDALWLHWPLSDESVSMCRWCRLQLVDLSLMSWDTAGQTGQGPALSGGLHVLPHHHVHCIWQAPGHL